MKRQQFIDKHWVNTTLVTRLYISRMPAYKNISQSSSNNLMTQTKLNISTFITSREHYQVRPILIYFSKYFLFRFCLYLPSNLFVNNAAKL